MKSWTLILQFVRSCMRSPIQTATAPPGDAGCPREACRIDARTPPGKGAPERRPPGTSTSVRPAGPLSESGRTPVRDRRRSLDRRPLSDPALPQQRQKVGMRSQESNDAQRKSRRELERLRGRRRRPRFASELRYWTLHRHRLGGGRRRGRNCRPASSRKFPM